jgi:hypothetical protein
VFPPAARGDDPDPFILSFSAFNPAGAWNERDCADRGSGRADIRVNKH